jgi:hypothetical protein
MEWNGWATEANDITVHEEFSWRGDMSQRWTVTQIRALLIRVLQAGTNGEANCNMNDWNTNWFTRER